MLQMRCFLLKYDEVKKNNCINRLNILHFFGTNTKGFFEYAGVMGAVRKSEPVNRFRYALAKKRRKRQSDFIPLPDFAVSKTGFFFKKMQETVNGKAAFFGTFPNGNHPFYMLFQVVNGYFDSFVTEMVLPLTFTGENP